MIDVFAAVSQVADAVLYEGYVLYPYRASSAKNRFRWQFGVLAPRSCDEDGEPWFSRTEVLAEPTPAAPSFTLRIRVRFLRPEPRPRGGPDGPSWLEGVAHDVDVGPFDLSALPFERDMPIAAGGTDVGLTIAAGRNGSYAGVRLTLENREPWHPAYRRDRDAMLRHSIAGAHLLLAIEGGGFVSLLDPPPAATRAAVACCNRHTWPVLAGPRGSRSLMLSSPIVLYDYPGVAKESPGDLCDAAEIDEILSLRILTMTDAEKAEARATDPRARAILERVAAMPAQTLGSLHGTLRSADFFNPPETEPPAQAAVVVDGIRLARGSPVRLRPNRRADAMDMFLRGQAATVAGVYHDVDDRVYVAVTVDADPGASLHDAFGRFFYFDPGELEPLETRQEQA